MAQKYIIPEAFVSIDYLLNCIELKLLQLLQDLAHSLNYFVFSINFFVPLYNVVVSSVCNSSLDLPFILITNLLLFYWFKYEYEDLLLIFHVFLWYIQYNLEYLTQNKNNLVIQFHNFTSELLFLVYCFCTALLYFSTCNKQTSSKE